MCEESGKHKVVVDSIGIPVLLCDKHHRIFDMESYIRITR